MQTQDSGRAFADFTSGRIQFVQRVRVLDLDGDPLLCHILPHDFLVPEFGVKRSTDLHIDRFDGIVRDRVFALTVTVRREVVAEVVVVVVIVAVQAVQALCRCISGGHDLDAHFFGM